MRFDLIAVLLVIAALASYANYRVLRLPTTIGLTLISLLLSLIVVVFGHLRWIDSAAAVSAVGALDFSGVLLHGMLAYLLFAGALHVDLADLRTEALPVAILATVGVFVTTAVVGTLVWGLALLLGIELPLIYGLLFGALIAPTDPIAVLGILKQVSAPHSLQVRLTGESLFNDGVGVALFLTLLGVATSGEQPDLGHAALVLLFEAAGGIVLGFVSGLSVYKLLGGVDEYPVEILLTIALAAGVYALAEAIHVSAPIAVVVAGVLIGNHGRASAMSPKTREHLDTFWELVDEILNAVLFVLIGLDVLLLRLSAVSLQVVMLAAGAIAIVLVGRIAGVLLPVFALRGMFPRGSVAVLTWAGLRGGISIALALSLPDMPYRNTIVVCTYMVVVFSIAVQGLTLGRLLRRQAGCQ